MDQLKMKIISVCFCGNEFCSERRMGRDQILINLGFRENNARKTFLGRQIFCFLGAVALVYIERVSSNIKLQRTSFGPSTSGRSQPLFFAFELRMFSNSTSRIFSLAEN